MIEACIFDLDGVIVDTARFHLLAWQRLANSLGIEFDNHDNEVLKGVARMESLEYILQKGELTFSDQKKKDLADKKNEEYKQEIERLTPVDSLPGVKEFLLQLKNNNIKIGLGSASKNAEMVLQKLELENLFDVRVDGTHTTKSKPDPQVFLLGSKQLDIAPNNIVVFEDAIKGLQAAKTGGFLTVGVGKEDILKEYADYVIPGFDIFSLTTLKNIFE